MLHEKNNSLEPTKRNLFNHKATAGSHQDCSSLSSHICSSISNLNMTFKSEAVFCRKRRVFLSIRFPFETKNPHKNKEQFNTKSSDRSPAFRVLTIIDSEHDILLRKRSKTQLLNRSPVRIQFIDTYLIKCTFPIFIIQISACQIT